MRRRLRYQTKRNLAPTRIELTKSEHTEDKSIINNILSGGLDLALIIAPLTALSYVIVYFYTLARFDYYKIPNELINIDLKNVLWILLTLVSFLYMAYQLTNYIISSKKYNYIMSNKIFGSIIFALLLVSTILLGVAKSMAVYGIKLFNKEIIMTNSMYIYLNIPVLFILFVLTFSVTTNKIKRTKKIDLRMLSQTIIVFGLFSMITSSAIGYLSAKDTTSYYITKSEPHKVVLGSYKDKFITAPINLKTNEIKPELSFVKIETDKDNKLIIEKVNTGILTVKEPKKINKNGNLVD